MPDGEPGGPIDPFSDHDLYDVLNGTIPAGEGTKYEDLHLVSQGAGIVQIHPDGYHGTLGQIDASDYDNVLDVVDELNRLDGEYGEY